jgi:hypothetical protein
VTDLKAPPTPPLDPPAGCLAAAAPDEGVCGRDAPPAVGPAPPRPDGDVAVRPDAPPALLAGRDDVVLDGRDDVVLDGRDDVVLDGRDVAPPLAGRELAAGRAERAALLDDDDRPALDPPDPAVSKNSLSNSKNSMMPSTALSPVERKAFGALWRREAKTVCALGYEHICCDAAAFRIFFNGASFALTMPMASVTLVVAIAQVRSRAIPTFVFLHVLS